MIVALAQYVQLDGWTQTDIAALTVVFCLTCGVVAFSHLFGGGKR